MSTLNSPRLFITAAVLVIACGAIAANLGPDDQQISFTGAAGTTATDAVLPVVAFEPQSERYLVVWAADDPDGEFSLHGQLLTGAGGVPLGASFPISPALGDSADDHNQPAIAVDESRGRFLVVWSSDELDTGAYEIHSQIVDSDGSLVGSPQRLSDMGSNDVDPAFDAVTPDVDWHPDLDAFIVVWAGDDDTGDLSDGRFELYGQLVAAATGLESGANDFRISYAGPDANGNDVLAPAVAAQPGSTRWWVAFEGDITDDDIHDPEIFIYGAALDVPDSFGYLVSTMGGGLNDGLSGRRPDLLWSPADSVLVCVWDGDNGGGTPRSIYGQRIGADGTLVGGTLALSADAEYFSGFFRESIHPAIALDPLTDEWVVAWQGDTGGGLNPFSHEIWAARFNSLGSAVDVVFSLSNMDPVMDPVAGAGRPALAVNTNLGSKLVAWSGDTALSTGDQHEIFTQAWTDDAFSGVDNTPRTPVFALHGAAPNPFNPQTKIAYDLPAAAPVSLRIYDTAGRLVRTLLADVPGKAGRNEVVWNGRDNSGRQAASGVYLYRLDTPGFADLGRMTLVK